MEGNKYTKMLVMKTLKILFSNLEQELGSNRKIDLVLLTNKQFLSALDPELPPSAFLIDKDGTVSFKFNFALELKAENNNTQEPWILLKTFLLTSHLKVKFKITSNPPEIINTNKTNLDSVFIDVSIKNIEFSQVKVFNPPLLAQDEYPGDPPVKEESDIDEDEEED